MKDYFSQIIQSIKLKQFTWDSAQELLKINEVADWDVFFTEIETIWMKNHAKTLKVYTPGKNFPAISVTGTECALSCAHCDKKYLENMLPAPTDTAFRDVLNRLFRQGSKGVLLSGGCTNDGVVPLLKYANIISEFKSQHQFFFNSHVGLVSDQNAKDLFQCGIDTVSFDLIVDPEIISNIFHLKATPHDYINSYTALKRAGLRVVPHILIGGNLGHIGHELEVLQFLMKDPPDLLVFIAMIPPKAKVLSPDTAELIFGSLTPEQIAIFFLIARYFLPNTELSLGCMRPRGKISENLERWSIQAGATRIEIPTQKTLKWAENRGYTLSYYAACCAIPKIFESSVCAANIYGKKV